MYLLDTNIISALARDPLGPVADKLADIDPDLVVTSTVVACEIRFGLAKNPKHKNAARSTAFLETMNILPLEPLVASHYAETRAKMLINGSGIDANDLLIAAHALSLGAVMVSDDRVFAAVPDLKVENWLRAEPAPLG